MRWKERESTYFSDSHHPVCRVIGQSGFADSPVPFAQTPAITANFAYSIWPQINQRQLSRYTFDTSGIYGIERNLRLIVRSAKSHLRCLFRQHICNTAPVSARSVRSFTCTSRFRRYTSIRGWNRACQACNVISIVIDRPFRAI